MTYLEVTEDDLGKIADLAGTLPTYLSCNGKGEVWPSKAFGHQWPEDRRPEHNLWGQSELLDKIVDVILKQVPRGGRFKISAEGVVLLRTKQKLISFDYT